jgi:hypothetical protein
VDPGTRRFAVWREGSARKSKESKIDLERARTANRSTAS